MREAEVHGQRSKLPYFSEMHYIRNLKYDKITILITKSEKKYKKIINQHSL